MRIALAPFKKCECNGYYVYLDGDTITNRDGVEVYGDKGIVTKEKTTPISVFYEKDKSQTIENLITNIIEAKFYLACDIGDGFKLYYVENRSFTIEKEDTFDILKLTLTQTQDKFPYNLVENFSNYYVCDQTSVQDIEVMPPIITLLGDPNPYIYIGQPYVDEGATAVDAQGNVLTVTTKGTVDTSATGNYILAYTATDANGVEGVAARDVTVMALEDKILAHTNVSEIREGQVYTIVADYVASVNRDVIVYIRRTYPTRELVEIRTETVAAGLGQVTLVTAPIPPQPDGSTFSVGAYMTPVGGDWNNNLPYLEDTNVPYVAQDVEVFVDAFNFGNYQVTDITYNEVTYKGVDANSASVYSNLSFTGITGINVSTLQIIGTNDINLIVMLRNSAFEPTIGQGEIIISNLQNGTYRVFIFGVENYGDQRRTYSYTVNNQTSAQIANLNKGEFAEVDIQGISVTDGTMTISFNRVDGLEPIIAAIRIYKTA